ncbi:ParA family protein [Neptuniibacter sp. QD37_11]|uniref:ParA family protein n=1 Tax=Neptuniibacter sp. QD37_11 TaxID=3398209 RepID=UPI0039F61D44
MSKVKIVTTNNQKGGIGKSTTLVHCAVYIGRQLAEAGVKILVIDLDPQGDSSAWMLPDFEDKMGRGELVCPSVLYNKKLQNPEDLIQASKFGSNIHVVPSGLFIMDGIKKTRIKAFENFKANVMKMIEYGDYDLVFFDTQAGHNRVWESCIYTSTHTLFPSTVDIDSFKGLARTLSLIEAMKKEFGDEIDITHLGTFFTQVSMNINELQALTKFKDNPENLKYGPFRQTEHRVAMKFAKNNQMSIWDKKTKASLDARKELAAVMNHYMVALFWPDDLKASCGLEFKKI